MGPDLVVHAFGPLWAAPLPTSAPFPLKLVTWLRMAGIPFRFVEENDPRKGPKGKSPWIVENGTATADSELILAKLSRERGIDLDVGLSRIERGHALAFRRLLEDHFHQVLEHVLFLQHGADARIDAIVAQAPAFVRPLARRGVRSAMREQLWQRGIARHAHDEILDMGRADLDAVADVLASREYFAGDRPSSIDATVFAFTVLAMHPPLPSPLFAHARSLPALRAYAARMIDRFVPESADVGRSLVAIDNAATPPPSSPL